jgi:hypothetical protein
MFQEKLKQYVLDNPKSVSMKPAGDGIFVLKYKKSVFYNNTWDDFLEHCRGTVVDKDFNLVSYPFQKIYNYQIESRAPVFSELDTVVAAFRKVNGFMVSVTVHRGELLISTTGSTDSDYVAYAREMMATHAQLTDWLMVLGTKDCQDYTFMFECVHPLDPHIIPEKPGMYLLGYRLKEWGSQVGWDPMVLQNMAEQLNCRTPEVEHLTVAALKNLTKTVRHEGFVFYDEHNVSAKIKSPYYLTSKWVARNPRTDKLVDLKNDIKHNLDEEYYPLVDAIRENIVAYTAMDEQARLAWVREQLA